MALADTVVALSCVPICGENRVLSDAQFFLLLIDKLATQTGIAIGDITSGDLATAVNDGLCDLEDRVAFSDASPEKLKAIALYLADQLA